jgi:predicted dehydrogenase
MQTRSRRNDLNACIRPADSINLQSGMLSQLLSMRRHKVRRSAESGSRRQAGEVAVRRIQWCTNSTIAKTQSSRLGGTQPYSKRNHCLESQSRKFAQSAHIGRTPRMSQQKVGVIGTGLIATHKHIPALKKLDSKAELVAVCDVNLEAAQRVAREFGIPRAYGSVAELLSAERPDMLDICTPPRTHAALAIEALKGGAHVMIEKPMAIDVAECDAIIEAAEETGRKICVAHSDLFYESFMKARERVARGDIGEFRAMRILLSTPTDYMTSRKDHWAHRLPGGVFGESGPHPTYLALAFINPIREVKVLGQHLLNEYPWSAFEDYRIDLVGSQGVCSVTLLYTSKHWAAEVEIWGSDGCLRADLESQALVDYRRPKLRPIEVGRSALSEAAQIVTTSAEMGIKHALGKTRNTHEILLERFVDSIQNETPSPVSMAEGREAVRVMGLITEQLEQQHAAAV